MSQGSVPAACDVPAVPMTRPETRASAAPAGSNAFLRCWSTDREDIESCAFLRLDRECVRFLGGIGELVTG